MNSISMISSKPNYNRVKFGAGENAQQQKQTAPSNFSIDGKTPLPFAKRLNMPPIAVAAANAFCWFSVGVLGDKLFSKIGKCKSGTKAAYAINTAFGLVMGALAYSDAKKLAKQPKQV